MDSTNPSPWSDLPADLLRKISSFLPSRLERHRLRSICRPWRDSIQSQPHSPNPHLAANVAVPFFNSFISDYTLSECLVYHLSDPDAESSNSSAIVAIEDSGDWVGTGREVQVRHPISKFDLPKPSQVPIDVSVFSVRELTRLYFIKSEPWGRFVSAKCYKVAACLKDGNLELPVPYSGGFKFDDMRVMCIVEEELMHWKMGEKNWVKIDHGMPAFPYKDVIFRSERFYAVDEARRLVIVDSDVNFEVVNSPDVLSAGSMSLSDTSYLVESDGELYLLVVFFGEEDDIRDPFNTKFLVYRFDEDERDWVRVWSLKDKAFFVDGCGSFSVCVSEVTLCQSNCIYFTVGFKPECSEYYLQNQKDKVCFTAVFDVEKGSCCCFAHNFDSPQSVFSWPLARWASRKVTQPGKSFDVLIHNSRVG